jgi:hypothetical protein
MALDAFHCDLVIFFLGCRLYDREPLTTPLLLQVCSLSLFFTVLILSFLYESCYLLIILLFVDFCSPYMGGDEGKTGELILWHK